MLTNEFHFAGVPHQISTDFMKTVKRLDGIDYDMHSKFLASTLPPHTYSLHDGSEWFTAKS